MQAIGLDILFSKEMLAWDGIEIDMLSRNALRENLHNIEELRTVEPKTILDEAYEKPNLEVVASEQTQLTGLKKEHFLKFLWSKEAAFQGKRGNWNGEPAEFELKSNARSFAMRPYQIPHALYQTTKR